MADNNKELTVSRHHFLTSLCLAVDASFDHKWQEVERQALKHKARSDWRRRLVFLKPLPLIYFLPTSIPYGTTELETDISIVIRNFRKLNNTDTYTINRQWWIRLLATLTNDNE